MAQWLLIRPHAHRVRPGHTAPRIDLRNGLRLELGRGCTLNGGLRTVGSVYAEPFTRIYGPVRAEGRIVLGAQSHVHGEVRAGLDIHLLPGVKIHGAVTCGADLHIHDGVLILAQTHAQGDVIIHGPARTGTLQAGGRVRTLDWPPSAWRDPAPPRNASVPPIPS